MFPAQRTWVRLQVRVTDLFVGETHCMRVDAVGEDGETVTAVQGHDSFRRCVGQSCAEFLLAIEGGRGRAPGIGAGVYTPERLFQDKEERKRLLDAMTSTEGTFTFRIERRE